MKCCQQQAIWCDSMIHNLSISFSILVIQTFLWCNPLLAEEAIQISIRSNRASVSKTEILVSDVCDIQGGSAQQRKKVGFLDLDDVQVGGSTDISKQQIGVRIALSLGMRHNIKISGPNSVKVSFVPIEDLQQRLEDKIRAELSSQFGIQISDVRIRLLDTSVLLGLKKAIDTTEFDVMAFLPAQLPLGEKYVQLELSDKRGNRINQKVHLRIVVLRDVFVTTKGVTRGAVITADHIQSIKRPMLDNSVELAGKDCLGCAATRDIPPHEILTTRHVTRKPAPKKIGLKRNDLVDILLIQGPLRIRVKNAKVMTNGSKGEIVRVLNTNSNKQINAVVVDQSTVVVKN